MLREEERGGSVDVCGCMREKKGTGKFEENWSVLNVHYVCLFTIAPQRAIPSAAWRRHGSLKHNLPSPVRTIFRFWPE